MKLLSILLSAVFLVACGGGDETPVAIIKTSVPHPVAKAATVSGGSAVAIHMYQALYGMAPSNATLNAHTAQATADPSAFARNLASSFASTSNTALAKLVLDNLGVTATTVTAVNGQGQSEYVILLDALGQMFTFYGAEARGQIILNATNLLAGLETDVTYGVTAVSYNYQATVNIAYSSNSANTVDAAFSTAVANQSDVNLAKSMFAELRTTLNAFANGSKTGLLDTQATRISDDLKANVAPEMNKVADNISALFKATTAFEDARAYTASNTKGFILNTSSGTLYRIVGSIQYVWDWNSHYDACFTDYAKGVTSKVVCNFVGPESIDKTNKIVEIFGIELTNTAPNQYTYIAFSRKYPVIVNSTGQYVRYDTSVSTKLPSGSGTLTKTIAGTTVTGLNVNGTFPPSALDAIGAPTPGVDTVAISVARTALPAPNNFRYSLTGSVSTTNLTDAEKVVSLSFDNGTILDMNEYTSNAVAATLIGTAQTASSKFTGTLAMGSFMKDADGRNFGPTKLSFIGNIDDSVQTLTGELDVSVASYSLYRSTLPESTTNYAHSTVTFTGTVQAPERPLLQLVVAASRTGLTTSTVTLNYSYGTVSIKGSGIADTSTNGASIMTLSNQDGISMAITSGAASSVTRVTKSGASLATIINGTINYADGYTESLM